MKKIDLTQLTVEELVIELKKRKKGYQSMAVIIGLMIGVTIYSTVKNGYSFFTIFPVFFIPLAIISKKGYEEVKKEIESRT